MVPEGGSAKLVCKARGYPKPEIIWKREDGAEIISRAGLSGGKTKCEYNYTYYHIIRYIFILIKTLSFTYRMWKIINKNLIDIYRLLWYDSWYTFWYFVLFYKFARLSDILKDYLEWKFVKFYLKVLWFSGRMTSGIIRWKRNSKFWRFSKQKRKDKSKIKRTKYGYKKKIVRIRIEMFHVA